MAQGLKRRAGKTLMAVLLLLSLSLLALTVNPMAALANSSQVMQLPGTSGGWDSKPEEWSSPTHFPMLGNANWPIVALGRQALRLEMFLLITFRWL